MKKAYYRIEKCMGIFFLDFLRESESLELSQNSKIGSWKNYANGSYIHCKIKLNEAKKYFNYQFEEVK
jgi:hypothetical protein